MLELSDVKKYFKDNRAVDGISFLLERGEILGLIGANGAGKTTTLSMIATLVKPDNGKILYEGVDIVKNPTVLRENLGYVPQETALYPSLTVEDNLRFWGRANHVNGKRLNQRIHEVSEMMSLDEETLKKRVGKCSGGIKRRINIAAALLHEPALVVMDEPTVGLDVDSRNQILYTIMTLKNAGASVIFAGHYLEEIEKICDKICIMDKGKCILSGSKEQLLKENKKLEQLYLEVTKG